MQNFRNVFEESLQMRSIILFSLFLVGCAASANPPAPDAPDAGNHNNGNLCCRVDQEIDGSPYTGGYYGCQLDGGTPVYAGTPMWLPWVCNSQTDHEDTCQDQDCVLGSSCRAYDGWGHVEACQ